MDEAVLGSTSWRIVNEVCLYRGQLRCIRYLPAQMPTVVCGEDNACLGTPCPMSILMQKGCVAANQKRVLQSLPDQGRVTETSPELCLDLQLQCTHSDIQ